MSKSTINEEVNRMRKIMGLNEGEEYVDDMTAAKSSARHKADFNQDAIDYVGGEDVWNRLSQDERESVLADIGRDWDRSRSMGEAEEVDLSKVDNPNAYTDDIFNHNAERAEDPFDDEEDSMRITIPIMSALSDIQERAPELAERINFIKALVQKMESNSVITDSELTALEKEFNTHSY